MLTELTIRTLRPPQRGQASYWDTQLTGFVLRISQGGAKTFSVVHGPDRKHVVIGRYPLVSLALARKRAREILLGHVVGPVEQPSLSFEDGLDRYLAGKEPDLRPATFVEHKRLLRSHFFFADTLIADISPSDAANALDAIPRPSEKAHAYTALKTFFNWCAARELCNKNPLATIPKPKTAPPRERALDEEELTRLWAATLDNTRYSLILRLLLLTAQRANQIASLHEGWIDYQAKVINFPAGIMKSSRPHTLPFGPLIEFHLRQVVPIEGYLFSPLGKAGQPFSGWSKSKRALDKLCRIDPWTLHDLRRTWATHSAQLSTEPHIIERVLAHAPGTGTTGKIAAIYNRFKYLEPMRDAIVRFENHIMQLCASM